MTTITAKRILASRNASKPDCVVQTLLCRYPRWIHAEMRTHRQLKIGEDWGIDWMTPSLMEDENLSRNAASSRAIPAKKMIDDVLADPAVPIWWGANEKGMQAREELTGEALEDCKHEWMAAMEYAVWRAGRMAERGAHKQIVNRVLEPYSHITVLVTATNWSNLLYVRDHPDAEPHIAMLAREIRKALEDPNDIQTLNPGDWHMPFTKQSDFDLAWQANYRSLDASLDAVRKLSVARCASTSYKTVDGFDMTMERAILLHDKLVAGDPLHASPAEHVCQALQCVGEFPHAATGEPVPVFQGEHLQGNFVGFGQYRKMLPGECR